MGDGLGFVFEFVRVFVGLVPLAARAIMLDSKLDPDEGEDETRLVTNPEVTRRLERSLYRRWFRAANYQRENIDRAVEGLPVDNCPRLTRAKRNLRRALNESAEDGAERKKIWRETGDNLRQELDKQTAIREVRAEVEYLANVMIAGIECERPVITLDGEGADGAPETIVNYDGADWPDHHTILLGAGGVGFRGSETVDLPMMWKGHEDKRPLSGIEAVEFYLNVAEKYGPSCSYVMFSFNYDATMLLKGLRQGRSNNWHYEKVWSICKRQDHETGRVLNNTIYMGDYAISYIKSKVLVIHKLSPDLRDEKGRQLVLKRITIYDVFGFYQCGFVKVMESLVSLGLATEEQVEEMRQNKARRNDFKSDEWPLSRIKAYTEQELRKLSVAVSVLRKAAFEDGIRLRRLDGAGNLSAGMMRKHKVMRHYKGLMVKYNAGIEQLIGYYTDFGGRIELVQQGFDEGGIVQKYDEKSSYPHKCVPLSSMVGGIWEVREHGGFDWWDIENADPLSMVQLKWALPERYVDTFGVLRVVPWYALPYRLEGGGIRFFSKGWGWFRRDDVVLLKRWLETFARLGACVNEDGSPYKMTGAEMRRLRTADRFTMVDLIELHLFHPANDEKPFSFVPEAFEKRKQIETENARTGKYNIAEKIIKLGLNGLSGKVAQSIGGSSTEPPGCYNVHYAAAIRAGTRRAIGEAALQAPHETVQFCTDAVFSKVPLKLDEGKGLGQWEREEVKGLLTVQSGVYSYVKAGKPVNMSRGYMAGSVDLEAIEKRLEREGVPDKVRKMVAFREALLTKVPNAWRQPVVKDGAINEASQKIELKLRTFMTAGSAVASRYRFLLIGRWALVPKKMTVHTPGPKRRLLGPDDFEGPDAEERAVRLYSTSMGVDGRRCHELVPTAPASPVNDTWNVMSKPHVPKWYEGDAELQNDWGMEMDYEDTEDIIAGDQ
jgi:hypothetical protein